MHLHVAGYALLHPGSRPAALAMLAAARAAGLPVSVDPSSAAPLRRGRTGRVPGLGRRRGAAAAQPRRGGGPERAAPIPAAAARALAAHAREVVVKLGAGGALWTDGGARRRACRPGRWRDADSTGAGDAFAGGLLAARLAGADPEEALRAGCALAAEAVARPGGR